LPHGHRLVEPSFSPEAKAVMVALPEDRRHVLPCEHTLELGRSPATRAVPGADRRDPAHQWRQAEAVVHIGAGDAQRQGKTVPVRGEVDFRSVLAAVSRIPLHT
jgi:hypothetical protein